MTAGAIGFSLLLLGLLLVVGKWIRVKTPILQNLFLPSSLIAGFLALILGPEVLGNLDLSSIFHWFEAGVFPAHSIRTWSALPSLMINVVFAALFLGKTLPSINKVWELAGPQVVLGYIISFGQYVVGLLLVILFLGPVFGVSPLAGALIEIGFVGGHGTAAGLGDTFVEMGFEDGEALAIGLATVGVLGGAMIGIVLINWGIRQGKIKTKNNVESRDEAERKGLTELDQRHPAGFLSTRAESIEPLSLHFGYIAISILIGFAILQAFIWLEAVTWGAATGVYLFAYVPLFPLAMLGGIITQYVLDKTDRYNTLDTDLITRIQGLALDILIVGALATLQLSVIADNIVPFTVLALGGILWTVFGFLVLAPRILPSYWFERGIGDFGQSMGVTATGLMLMRVTDPENKSPALESFGYKQLLFEPFVGGGLFTAASVPLIHQFGATSILIFTGSITLILLLFGLFYFRR
ncbi:sodium/glutamate symporter [Proteinivorax hydrogeniformans]|uniref:Sodium/glutamate symporter n=1 Tax=Proteinivorax hydrogeniformans TaxID=1826727 RepID=A0AAU8HWU2_9FIRM